MHFWVEYNSKSGRCHDELEDARIEIIDGIIQKMGTARSTRHQVECAEGIIAANNSYSDGDPVVVGRDSWRIIECVAYTCNDRADRRPGDW